MIKVDEKTLSKVDLKITTNGLYTLCEKCKNSFAVGNCENFGKEVREMLENALIYGGIDEKGVVELSHAFECPICFGRKIVPLEFRLETEKTLLIFSLKVSKNAELLANSSEIFKKQMPKNSANAKKIGDERDEK